MLLLICSLLPFTLSPPAPQDIVGTWVNTEGTAHIEIYQDGDTYTGKIVWLKQPTNDQGEPWRDRNNPDEALQNRTIMGMPVLSGLRYEDGEYVDGTIYSAEKGGYADAEAELVSADQLELSISYSWFFSATRTWTRL